MQGVKKATANAEPLSSQGSSSEGKTGRGDLQLRGTGLQGSKAIATRLRVTNPRRLPGRSAAQVLCFPKARAELLGGGRPRGALAVNESTQWFS